MNNMIGKQYGRLTVLSFIGRNKQYDSLWECKCKCGTIKVIRGGVLKNGHTQSCGCLHKDNTSVAKTTHGLIKDNYKLYKVWIGMKQRCYNSKCSSYKNYGQRGIKLCENWVHSFENFHSWSLANGYSEGLTIERENVNGNYEASNCSWIVKERQSANRRNSIFITFNGLTKTSSEWSEITGIPTIVLTQRIRRGWSSNKTITTKINKK